MPVYFYTAFGHKIRSDFKLPELTQIESDGSLATDISIIRSDLAFAPPDAMACKFDFTPSGSMLSWSDVGGFYLPDAGTIIVTPKHGISEDILRLPLLGPVLALLLHYKGYLVLHASGIALTRLSGVGFLGDKGAGKSTTAAAFLRRKHHLLSDDILAIATEPELRLASGFPQMKLDRCSSEAAALSNIEKLPEIGIPGFDKRKHLVTANFSIADVHPKRLYVLQRGEKLSTAMLSERDAFRAILRFSYLSRFGNIALQGTRAEKFFSQCTLIAQRQLVAKLTVPDGLSSLDDIVSFVQSEVSGLSE